MRQETNQSDQTDSVATEDKWRNGGLPNKDMNDAFPVSSAGEPEEENGLDVAGDTLAPEMQEFFPTELHRMAAESLGLDAVQQNVLVGLFHSPSYRRCAGLGGELDDAEVFQHFLAHGVEKNISPGPFFDAEYCAQQLAAQGMSVEQPVLLSWLHADRQGLVIPTPLFDGEYYLCSNQDVVECGMQPFHHFLLHGQSEVRLPNPRMDVLTALIQWQSERSPTPVFDLYSIFPNGHAHALAEEADFDTFHKIFQIDFYLAQLRQKIVQAVESERAEILLDNDALEESLAPLEEEIESKMVEQWGETINEHNALEHFVFVGSREGFRPTILFNEAYYRAKLDESLASPETDAPNSHDDEAMDSVPSVFPCSATDIPFWHWFCVGRPNRIIPTPLYDDEFYRTVHNDLKNWKRWLFEHYLFHGITERFRAGTDIFNPNFYYTRRPKVVSAAPLVDFVVQGDALGIRPAPDVSLAMLPDPGKLWETSRLERFALTIQGKLDRLKRPDFKSLIDHAAHIEPMVLRPYGRREYQCPPFKHAVLATMEMLAEIRLSLAQPHYDTIVLIPHCRIAGSARVAGTLVNALRALFPSESLLLVLTDLSEFQRPDWFANDIHILDLFAHISDVGMATRVTVLLDLIRGLTPKRVINVNSRLAWEFMQSYGEQFATWTDLYAYLFTWDLDQHGNKGGYPINFFYPSFDAYSGVFIDNQPLVEEIRERYALSTSLGRKLHLLHTAAEPADISYETVFEGRRRQGKRLRCFWVGRFDRQKRFDIVLEIARQRPDLEILAWGKQVLNDFDTDWKNLPENIKLQGTYEEFDELPLRSFDFFLYTSEWDGLPTILIDMGAHGVATVASRVGGTADLINDQTAWPVDDVLDPAAYLAVIESMCADPAEVGRRAAAFKAHTMATCSESKYRETLQAAFFGGKHG